MTGPLASFTDSYALQLEQRRYAHSDNDNATLVAETERLDTPLRRATIGAVIGLLAVTGMRIGEVIGGLHDKRH